MSVVRELRAAVGDDAVVTDPDVTVAYRRDHAGFVPDGAPLAVVFPETVDQVRDIVRVAGRNGTPLVPRGAGSGLAGGANAIEGGVVLVMTRMNRILELDATRATASVQPGVLNGQLKAEAAKHGLWYPPDPASAAFSTIGGNLATNAGGLCCSKYGVTRDWVLSLQVVLADASVVTVGRRSVKGVAGYDLVSLFVGSEGTLGLVTEALLRLRPAPSPRTTLIATFGHLPAAGTAIADITRTTTPAMLEILDRTTIAAIERWKRMELDTEAAALLIAQSDLPGQPGRDEIAAIARSCDAAGADLVVTTSDPDETEMLLAARRFAYPALEQVGDTLLDDVAVPRSELTTMLSRIEEIALRHDLTIGTFGHAGDGNLHPTIVHDAADPQMHARVQAAFADIVDEALALGGTVTGEHGIGLLKRDHLQRELGADGLRLHQTIKAALDPRGILNPGKVLDTGLLR